MTIKSYFICSQKFSVYYRTYEQEYYDKNENKYQRLLNQQKKNVNTYNYREYATGNIAE